MSLNNPNPHHGHASEYQASGFPFVAKTSVNADSNAARLVTISFPYVTRWVIINVHNGLGVIDGNINAALFGFGDYDADEGVKGDNAVNITTVRNIRMEVKCNKCFIRLPASKQDVFHIDVVAGLTNVQERDFPAVSSERYLSGVTTVTKRGDNATTFNVFTAAVD